MKLSSITFLACLLLLPYIHRGQERTHAPTYELFVSAGTPVKQILDDLTLEYGLEFSYPSHVAEQKITRNRALTHVALDEFLSDLFAFLDIGYRIENNKRILLRKDVKEREADNFVPLKGQITDEESGVPLSHVMVYSLADPSRGALTDHTGSFELQIPSEALSHSWGVRLLGYETLLLTGQSLLENPHFSLKIKPFLLSEIPIEDNYPEFTFRADDLALGIRNTGRTSPSNILGNDALRSLQLLPGISSDDDLSAGVRIRGSESNETLIVLDGIPIYKAEHFFGVFSSINSQYVSEIQLYKNALPVEYGGRTGGMVLLSSDSQLDRLGAKVDINALTASARVDIPIGRDGGFILQGRSTYSNAAESKIFNLLQNNQAISIPNYESFARTPLLEVDPNFRFYDMNGKFFFRPTEEQYIDVNFFHSNDRLNNTYTTDYATLQDLLWVDNQESFSQENTWQNTGFSINYRHDFAPNWQVKSRLFYTDYVNENSISVAYSQAHEDFPIDWNMNNVFLNSITDVGGELSLSHSFSQKQSLQIGIGVNQHQNFYEAEQKDYEEMLGNRQGNEIQLFGNYKVDWDDWVLNVGGRLTQYDVTNEIFFSPRLTLSYFVLPEFSLKTSFNQDYQFVRDITHENIMSQGIDFLILANGDEFPVGKVNNYMLGATYTQPTWSVDVEFFNKNLYNVVENALSIPGFAPAGGGACPGECAYSLFQGNGRAIGMDLILYVQNSIYSGTWAYTLSRNSQRFDNVFDGARFPADDDQRHQFKWTNSLTLGNFRLTGNYIFSSGRPFTDLSRLHRRTERIHLSPDQRISRLPEYQRVDVGVDYSFLIGGLKASTGFSVFNLTNHQNVKYLQYLYAVPARDGSNNSRVIGNQTNMLSRTFNVSFKLDI